MNCALNIKASNGKNSVLFKSLASELAKTPSHAVEMYYYTMTDQFKSVYGDWENGKVDSTKLDSNGEPTFGSIVGSNLQEVDYTKVELSARASIHSKIAETQPKIEDALTRRINQLKGRKGDFSDIIDRLSTALALVQTKELDTSLPRVIELANEHLKALKENMKKELKTANPDINKLAGLNKSAHTYHILTEVQQQLYSNFEIVDELGLGELDMGMSNSIITEIQNMYLSYARTHLANEFHSRDSSWSKSDIHKWLDEVPRDTGFMEQMLEYAGDSHDRIVAASANVIMSAEHRKRREQIIFTKQLQEVLETLEKKYPGAKAEQVFNDMIYQKPNGEMHILPMTIDPKTQPDLYAKMNKLKKDKEKYAFYEFFYTTYLDLQTTLPADTRLGTRLPTVLKGTWERAEGKGIKEKMTALNDEAKKKILSSNLDMDKGELLDATGKPVRKIPTFYTQKYDTRDFNAKSEQEYKRLIKEGATPEVAVSKAETIAEAYAIKKTAEFITKDLALSLASFHAMAINYSTKNDVINTLDAALAVVGSENRKYYKLDSNGNKIRDKSGSLNNKYQYTTGAKSAAYQTLSKLMDMQVYGMSNKDLGEIDVLGFGKVDVDKTLRVINNATSLIQLSANVFAAIPNIGNGEFNNMMEATAGEFYTWKEYKAAGKLYRTNLGGMVNDIGARTPKNFISLMDQHYNMLQDFNVIGDVSISEGSTAKRMMKTNALFFMNNMGEHFMQLRTSLAVMDNFKTYSKDGAETGTLTEAHSEVDGKLVIRPDTYIKDKDGTLVKYDTAQQDRLSNKMNAITRKMYGNYNSLTANAAQQDARLALVTKFRRWAYEGVVKRYGKKQYYTNLEQDAEGFYRTGRRFFKQMMIDMKDMEFQLMRENWSKLTPHEKANIKRMVSEASAVTLLIISGALLANAGKAMEDDYGSDDFKDRLALGSYRMLVYQTNRLYTELFAYLNPLESLRLAQSPMAATSILENTIKLGVQVLTDPFEHYDTGWRKGQSKTMVRLEKLIPVYKQIKVLNPDGIKDKGVFYNL